MREKFLKESSLDYQNVAQLLQIMIATAANTSPVERGYSFLEMIASKRRNRTLPENLETQFLLACLKIPVKEPENYKNECKRLENKSYIYI